MNILRPYAPKRDDPVPLKPRSAWRQKLLDDAYADIDACTCHTDFALALARHAKAWLAEANQWNAVPRGSMRQVWDTFAITHPNIKVQVCDLQKNESHYWYNIEANMKPGLVSMPDFMSVIPLRTAVAVKDLRTGKTLYRHPRAQASGGYCQASALTKTTDVLPYQRRMNEAVGLAHAHSQDYVEEMVCSAKAREGAQHDHPDTWLGRRLAVACADVKAATSLKALSAVVQQHRATWYAAAKRWDNGPQTEMEQQAMDAYTLPVTFTHLGPQGQAEKRGLGTGGLYGIDAAVALNDAADLVMDAAVLRQIPLGFYLPSNLRGFDACHHKIKKSDNDFVMRATLANSFSAIPEALDSYVNVRTLMGLFIHTTFKDYETHASVTHELSEVMLPLQMDTMLTV